MQLNELFDTSGTKFEIINQRQTAFAAKTKLENGKTLLIACNGNDADGESEMVWDIDFKVNGMYGATDDQNGPEVFGKVVEALRKFVEIYRPEYITMSSDGASRTSLYLRMLKRLLPGWSNRHFEDIGTTYIFMSETGKYPIIKNEDGGFIHMPIISDIGYYAEKTGPAESWQLRRTPELKEVFKSELESCYKWAAAEGKRK